MKEKLSNEYLVTYILQTHKNTDRYLCGNIKFIKDLKSNTIKSIILGKNLSDRATEREVSVFLHGIRRSKMKDDINFIITSVPIDFRRTGVKFLSPYNIEDEDRLINLYMAYQKTIKYNFAGDKLLKPNRMLGLGRGIYLDDGVKPPRFRIDYNEIDILSIGIMLGLRYVLNTESRNILRSILDDMNTQDNNIFQSGKFTSSEPPKSFLENFR
jgi:hypothetical protein